MAETVAQLADGIRIIGNLAEVLLPERPLSATAIGSRSL
jgi:hypothetical protein